ncbi:hypothetical protein HQ865_22160 [Mucilaginibacter mali]|uniref:Uncharacterized protein n=1 Tax=Mucilaginibacter mali TaxID=2740462 RepID=A0A7D4PWD8_9SPHI|nr:hypothetical protein [Mucilaginibacter mali]QKJ32348.1 hypothetical protein HQ865_22160 [Mucilaginibacter mali]
MNPPAAHQTHQADTELLFTLLKVTQRLKRDCYICDIVLLLYTLFMYNKYLGNDIEMFIYCELGMVIFLGFAQYLLIVAKGKFINKVVVEIVISEGIINLKTAAFSGPFWFKKESVDYRLKQADTRVSPVVNPYPSIFKKDKQITLLKHKATEVYIIDSYYTWELGEQLYEGN